jgi:hypothetical protein
VVKKHETKQSHYAPAGSGVILFRDMGKFRQLEDFERRFETMSVDELHRWKSYWTKHAQTLKPKVRKLAMKRVHKIDKAISRLTTQ